MGYKLSVGFNGNLELLEKMYEDKENKIGTLYTGGYLKEVTSGRYQHSKNEQELEKIVEAVHNKNSRLAVTLNSPCNIPPLSEKQWWGNVKNYLKNLESIGVDTAIIAHPFIMSLAKENTNLSVAASIICDVNTQLKKIKSNLKKAKLALLVNEACLGNCPWRRFHQNALSHADRKEYDLDYAMSCTNLYKKNPYMMLTNNVVRPEDLKKYEGISDMFKLVGRTTDQKTLLKMIHAYSTESYHGNLVEIVDKGFSEFINLPNNQLDSLFEQKSNCIKNCQNCSNCKTLYRKINK